MKRILKSYNIFTAVIALVLILTVICTPIFGLGDLSEYTSVFQRVGLYNMSENTAFIAQNYGIATPDEGGKSVFEMFLILMININKIFSANVFNIHFISIVYCIVFLLGMYFLQKNVRLEKDYLNYAFSAFLTIVFLDLGYVAYFNSFYSEAMIFVLIIAIAATAVSMARKFSCLKLVVFAVIACLLSALRLSAAVVALAAAAVLFVAALNIKGKEKAIGMVLGAVIAVVSVVSMFTAQVPAHDVKLYSHIYGDLAMKSDTALAELGLTETELGMDASIEDMEKAVEGVTYGDVAKYYISNPSVFFDKLKTAVNNSYFLQLEFAEYTEAGAHYGVRENLCLKIWNTLKKRVIPQGIWVMLIFIAAYIVMAIREYIKYKKSEDSIRANTALFALILPVGALAEWVGTVITTGEILISKNMFVFNVYFDLMLVTAIVWAAATLIASQEAIKNKYGVNQ